MRKLLNQSGMTLMEMMAALLVMVLLITAMGTGMDAGMRIYSDSMFESNSASLAGIVNTALSDLLRYAQDVESKDVENGQYFKDDAGNELGENVGFVFTNVEYGIRDAYFYTPVPDDNSSMGALKLKSLHFKQGTDGIHETDLVNTGAYPNLAITNFEITYAQPGSGAVLKLRDGTEVTTTHGGYFYITYDIVSTSDTGKCRSVESVVRLINVRS